MISYMRLQRYGPPNCLNNSSLVLSDTLPSLTKPDGVINLYPHQEVTGTGVEVGAVPKVAKKPCTTGDCNLSKCALPMIDIIRGEWFWLQDCHHFYVTLRSFLKVKAHLRGQRSPEQNNVDNAQNKEAIILN